MDEPPTLRRRLTRRLFLPGAVVAATFLLVGLVSGNGALVVGAFAPVGLAAVAMAIELSQRRSQADLKRWSPPGTLFVAPATLEPAAQLRQPPISFAPRQHRTRGLLRVGDYGVTFKENDERAEAQPVLTEIVLQWENITSVDVQPGKVDQVVVVHIAQDDGDITTFEAQRPSDLFQALTRLRDQHP